MICRLDYSMVLIGVGLAYESHDLLARFFGYSRACVRIFIGSVRVHVVSVYVLLYNS
jgi:hypothetical protein